METVIEVNKLSKKYRLGSVGTGSFTDDIKRYWARIIGKEDPTISITQRNVLNDKNKLTNHDYVWVLRDVNFEVKKGEVLGIIGKNGAGKSTLLKILSKVTSPTIGEVKVKGRIASLLEVGTGFNSELTGRENIFLNGSILGMSKNEIKAKFDEIIDFSGVERYIDTPVKRYSSGMYVRLAFAVAAYLEPDILILDEVLAVGDAEFQKKCLGKMKDVSEKDGRTVLFVSHNLTVISNLCNRVFLFEKGSIMADGDSLKVISKYSELFEKAAGCKKWDDILQAPGSENVKLKSVRIISNGQITSEIDIQDDFIIEFEYWNAKKDISLTSYFHIADAYGTVVMSSGNLDSVNKGKDFWFNKMHSVGVYKAKCVVPGKMLNTGKYTLNISVQSDIIYHEVFALDLLSFTVVDKKEYCKEYHGIWPGFFRPKLEWGTEKID